MGFSKISTWNLQPLSQGKPLGKKVPLETFKKYVNESWLKYKTFNKHVCKFTIEEN